MTIRQASTKASDRVSDYFTGETTGDIQANADYSSGTGTPETFSFGPPSGEVWICKSITIAIADTADFNSNEYGGLGAILPNGYDIEIRNTAGDTLTKLNGSRVIQVNEDVGAIAFEVSNIGLGVTGAKTLFARIDFTDAPLRLVGTSGEKLAIDFSDNLTGLTYHSFFVTAVREVL